MKNIINWTFGSFFRTIGRITCYLIIGGILAYFVSDGFSRGDFSIAQLFGIQRVMAEEVGIYHLGWDVEYYSDNTFNNRLPSNDWFDYHVSPVHTSPNATLATNVFYIKPMFDTIDLTPYKGGYITIPFHMTLPTYYKQNNSTIYGSEYCSNLNCTGYDTSLNYCYKFTCNQSGGSADSTLTNYEYVPPQINLSIKLEYSNGYIDICRYNSDTSTIMCPITSGVDSNWSLKSIQVSSNVFYDGTQLGNYTLNMMRKINFYSSAFVDIIESQSQTTNAVNSVNQTISDTNATTESSSASDFFHDYNETAQDGIIAVVSMPLNIFNALTLGSTEDLCFTLKGKQVCLPSGDIIWGKSSRTSIRAGNATYTPHPFSNGGDVSSGVTAFKVIFNLVVGGYLCYKMLKSLMRITNDMLNPTKDKLEVLEL